MPCAAGSAGWGCKACPQPWLQSLDEIWIVSLWGSQQEGNVTSADKGNISGKGPAGSGRATAEVCMVRVLLPAGA